MGPHHFDSYLAMLTHGGRISLDYWPMSQEAVALWKIEQEVKQLRQEVECCRAVPKPSRRETSR